MPENKNHPFGEEPVALKRDDRVGRIYVCQPAYASGSPHSHKQFWVGLGKRYGGECFVTAGGGSLLANTFNGFWAHALNLQEAHDAGAKARKESKPISANPHPQHGAEDYWGMWNIGWNGGRNITHFAMLHDDIVPEDGWLDVLVEDLLRSGADVVSAVVPIKDPFGVTSTAIDNPDDPFLVERRLTLHEVMRLPEVFGLEDTGYAHPYKLLLNTGCWVCDFTKPWRHAVEFTIRDRLRRHAVHGRWVADVASEDWNFSRDVQALGATVRATRRVRLDHVGASPFSNRQDWGTWTYDLPAGDKAKDRLVPPASNGKPVPVTHPSMDHDAHRSERFHDVPGWLTDVEGAALLGWAKGKRVLEIGAYCGRSTIWLAEYARVVHVIDTFDGRGTPEPRDTLEEFKENVARHVVSKGHASVHFHRGTSEHVVRNTDFAGPFDLVFIDGDHDRRAVALDIELCLPLLSPGGRLAFHDYDRPGRRDSGVTDAVDDFIEESGAEVIERVGALALVAPAKTWAEKRGRKTVEV